VCFEPIDKTNLSAFIQEFVGFTFDIIEHQPDYIQAAVFTFGREDLIPDMFIGLVKELSVSNADKISTFKYYLERHIEIDGDAHGPASMSLIASLCDNDPVKIVEAEQAAIKAIHSRIALWDGVFKRINPKKLTKS
jgi:hypothetical protein